MGVLTARSAEVAFHRLVTQRANVALAAVNLALRATKVLVVLGIVAGTGDAAAEPPFTVDAFHGAHGTALTHHGLTGRADTKRW
jgi:ribosomal protein L18E